MRKKTTAAPVLFALFLPLLSLGWLPWKEGQDPPNPVGSSLFLNAQTKPAAARHQTQAPPGDQSDTVELASHLVTVTATVVSLAGGLVKDLKAEDFELFEDGVPQSISTFSRHSDLPLSMVMVFDTSLSVKSRLGFEKETVGRFLRTVMRPIDVVAVVSVSTDVTLEQYFTSNLNHALSAIDRLNADGATALYDAVEASAGALVSRQGRRIIVILSDGRDTISRITLRTALKRAQETDALIYGVNTSGRPFSANSRELAGERALEELCKQTGGEAFFPDRAEELDPVFRRLADQLRTQYVLGFSSTNEARDGSYRRLSVRVKRPDVQARTREGYYALRL